MLTFEMFNEVLTNDISFEQPGPGIQFPHDEAIYLKLVNQL